MTLHAPARKSDAFIFTSRLAVLSLVALALMALALAAPAAQARSYTLIAVASFNGTNGQYPVGGLTDMSGTLYGTTGRGGAHNDGTVFSVNTITGVIHVLADFNGKNGGGPNALTTVEGTLYGTTDYGGTGRGATGEGTVFSFDPTTGVIRNLVSFTDATGDRPGGRLLDVNGTFYGTTREGGKYGDGTIFALKPNTTAVL